MSLSVELTGLQAAQTDLDTIGNNIANVGTVGFKASTPNFSDIYGASLGGAGSAGSPGQGVLTNSLSQLFTEGTISQTGNPLDVAIDGSGFFQVQTPTGIAYSRDGALQLRRAQPWVLARIPVDPPEQQEIQEADEPGEDKAPAPSQPDDQHAQHGNADR